MIRLLLLVIIILFYSASTLFSQNIKINEICSNNYVCFEDGDDDFGDWVELYNAGNSSVNLAGMYLTDNFSNLIKYRIPTTDASETTISSHSYLIFWLDEKSYKGETHANFKLSNNGERLALVASNGVSILDSVSFDAIPYDASYGRTSDGSSSWSYFRVPTPDDNNTGGGYVGVAGKAAFSIDAGFYPSSIQVELYSPDPSSTVYYSLNGNEPSPSRGILYTGPININATTVMRARVYKTNYVPGEVTTRSYFINRTIDLPVISVVTDPLNLWDDDIGIYTFGPDDYDHFYPYYGANWWHDWKRPAHFEYFLANGAEVISQNLNLSISGNTSRVYAQKSLNLEAKDELGKDDITYQVFPQLPMITEFKALKLRNGGGDWSSTGIRDAFNHALLEGAMDVDHQSSTPVILYLNGAYWGIMNLTEKLDEDYINGHYPTVDKDSLDILFSNAEVEKGDANNYNSMINFIASNSLAQQSNYNYIKTQIDIPEFINYFESRIYYATTDWPYKNIKFWRPKDLSRKWRWIMWDTDRSDALTRNPNHPCDVNHNTLAWATTSSSVASWSQFLLNNLLLNSEFKSQFITQFAHHMNFSFCPQRTDSLLDIFRSRLHDELPAHIAKWSHSNDTLDYYTVGYYQSRSQWNTEVDTIELFFHNRAGYVREDIMQKFGINNTSELSLVKNPPQGGVILVDTFQVPPNSCDLIYFDGYPVTLRAVPNPGYTFKGWTNSSGNTLPLTWRPDGDTTVTAYFITGTTNPTQPTNPSSNFSSTVSNCSNIHLNWTQGNGSSRIVVARAASAVNAWPADQNSYTANSDFGDGDNLGGNNFVVYSGSGSSCTITGLTAGVTYHFAIIEFNGSSATSAYNTTSYLTGSKAVSLPSVNLNNFNNVCLNAPSFSLTGGTPAGGNYSGAGISGGSFNPSVAGAGNHVITYLYTNSSGCSSQDTSHIFVSTIPSVGLNNFNNVCLNAPSFALTGGTPAGGNYSGIGVSNGSFNPSAAGIGNHVITYTFTNTSGCSATDNSNIIVNNIPSVNLSSFNNVCVDAPSFVLTGGTPAGGNYSGTGVSSGSYNPSAAGAGNHVITYTYTNSSGCSATDNSNIFVSNLPTVSLNSFNNVCLDAPSFTLTGGTPAGGNYTGAGVSGNTFDPSVAGTGSHVITYSYTNASGCSAEDNSNILVSNLPTVSLNSFNNVCLNAPSFTLTGGTPAGGNYSGVGVSNGSFNPSSAGTGNHVITYTFTNTSGCSAADNSNIIVNNIPTVSLNSFNNVCLDAPSFTLTGGTPAGGVYSGIGISGGSFDPSGAGSGNHVITYSYSNASGCSAEDISNIFVSNLPTVSLNSFNNVCLDAPSFTLTGGTPAGGNYSGAGVSGNTLDPAIAGSGSHVITYSYTNASGCSDEETSGIFVSAIPSVSLGSDTTICVYNTILLDAGPGFSSYLWSTGLTSQTILADSNNVGVGTGIYLVTVTNSDGCSDEDEVTITYDICSNISGVVPFGLNVFPNPFNDEIIILTGENNFKVTMFDVCGKIVFIKQVHASNPVIHPTVTDGIYFLQIETKNELRTVKIVKASLWN